VKGLQLVGYTADLHHLVVDEADGRGRFRVSVDEDLVATLQEVLEQLPEDHPLAGALDRAGAPSSSGGAADGGGDRTATHAAAPVVVDDDGDPVDPAAARARRSGGLAGAAVLAVRARDAARSDPSGTGRRSSLLSPREIQVLLRAGVGTGLVAQRAQTDEEWVRRWLPPIAAERDRVLSQAFTARVAGLAKAPPGPALGDAVRDHLRADGLDPDGADVEWQVTRRELDTSWTVTFRHDGRDGRSERARWRFDPESRRLEALDDRARELGGVPLAPAPAAAEPPPSAAAAPRLPHPPVEAVVAEPPPPAAAAPHPPVEAVVAEPPPPAAAAPRLPVEAVVAEPPPPPAAAPHPPPPAAAAGAPPVARTAVGTPLGGTGDPPAPLVEPSPDDPSTADPPGDPSLGAPATATSSAAPTPRGDRRQRRRAAGSSPAAPDGGDEAGPPPAGPASGATAATPRRRRPRGPAPG